MGSGDSKSYIVMGQDKEMEWEQSKKVRNSLTVRERGIFFKMEEINMYAYLLT